MEREPRNPAERIIARFGGQSALANLLGNRQSTIQRWAHIGRIPSQWQGPLVTATGLTVTLLLAGCGGGSPRAPLADGQTASAAATTATKPTATALVATPGAETEPGAVTPVPEPCRDAGRRDGAGRGRFFISLADPVCIDMRPLAPASVVLELADGRRLVHEAPASTTRYQVPGSESPYGPNGCARDPRFSLLLTVTVLGEQTPAGRASISCAPDQVAEGCAPPGGTPDGLRLSGGSGAGRRCLFWTDRYSRESGFRVEITYPNIDRVYAYILPANNIVFQIPDEAGPDVPEAFCKARTDVSFGVVALIPGEQDGPVGSTAIVSECGP